MDYSGFLTLAEAKTYLRVNANSTENDDMISVMIETALQWIEERSNILVVERTKIYQNPSQYGIRVYDAPINSVTTPISDRVDHDLYSHFYLNATELELSVGYQNPADAPTWIKSVALEIIDLLYYGAKDGNSIDEMLSPMSKILVEQNKRFLI